MACKWVAAWHAIRQVAETSAEELSIGELQLDDHQTPLGRTAVWCGWIHSRMVVPANTHYDWIAILPSHLGECQSAARKSHSETNPIPNGYNARDMLRSPFRTYTLLTWHSLPHTRSQQVFLGSPKHTRIYIGFRKSQPNYFMVA